MSKLFETIHLGQKILHFNVPMEIVDEINLTYQNNIKDLKEHNQYLAGKIKDEHKINNLLSKDVKRYFESCFRVYLIECKEMYNINLKSAWVNEMKANEYNPMHIHTGHTNLGLSSVLILKLPKTFGEEYSRKENPANGLLEFNGNGGGMFSYNQCKMHTKVGDLLIFPYDLRHGVYPFNSTTECRRTLSYNCDLTNSHKVLYKGYESKERKYEKYKKTWIVQTPFSSPFGPFHNEETARKWSDIVKSENPKFRYDVNVVPLHYVNSDPFSSATIVLTKVKNNRKRMNRYEYIEA